MRIHLHIAAAVLIFGFVAFDCSGQNTKIASSGSSTLRTGIEKKAVNITFHTFVVKKSDPRFPAGLDYYEELSLMQRMGIAVAGRTLWVPRSAFADLINPRSAAIRSEKGLFVLSIFGLDGADAYELRIYFDSTKVTRRAFYDLETSTDQPLEETRYAPPRTVN